MPVKGTLLQRLKTYWETSKKWIVRGVIAATFVALYLNAGFDVSDSLKLKLLPGLVLLVVAIVFETLHGIEVHLRSEPRAVVYSRLHFATTRLEEIVRSIRKNVFEVVVVGSSGGATESQIIPLVLECAPTKKIHFKIYLVDVENGPRDQFPAQWIATWRTNVDAIVKKLRDPRYSLTIYTFDHLPVLSGILVDNTHLFLGCHQWSGSAEAELDSAGHPHVYLDPRLGELAEHFVELLSGWSVKNPRATQVYPPLPPGHRGPTPQGTPDSG